MGVDDDIFVVDFSLIEPASSRRVPGSRAVLRDTNHIWYGWPWYLKTSADDIQFCFQIYGRLLACLPKLY